jgi:hypothetical protein
VAQLSPRTQGRTAITPTLSINCLNWPAAEHEVTATGHFASVGFAVDVARVRFLQRPDQLGGPSSLSMDTGAFPGR